MENLAVTKAPTAVRDPDRKERILAVAADLVAQRGYHAVSMTDIGNAAGISGPGIYRHYTGKPAVLVALFDRVIDRLNGEALDVVRMDEPPGDSLRRLINGQVNFVVTDRMLAQVYYVEFQNLPDADRRRLRRKQRLYLEEWVHLLGLLRVDLNDGEIYASVHAAIGAIQSTLFHSIGLPEERLRSLLADAARSVLGTA
jgi:AcrR family transcriptional regulator